MIEKIQHWLMAAFQPGRWKLGRGELLLTRLMIVWVIWDGFFFGINQADQSIPVGLAHFMDLSFLQNWDTSVLLIRIWGVAAILFVLGWVPVVALGYMVFLMVAWGSLRNSYGNIHHGTQIIGMVILGYFAAYMWRLWAGRKEGRSLLKQVMVADHKTHALGWWWAFQAAAATYVVAGWSKLETSGLAWLTELPNMSLHVEKLGWQHYMGTGERALLEKSEGYATLVAGHPWLTIVLVGSGLFFELLAFIGLFGRVWAAVFGVGLYVMHIIVIEMMQLEFPLNSWVLLIFFVNLPFLIMWVLRKVRIYDDQKVTADL